MPNLDNYLNIAIEAVNRADSVLQSEPIGSDSQVLMNHGKDIKIQADKNAESVILDCLKEATPFNVLSEEAGYLSRTTDDKEYLWIVDPLDGTYNFTRQIPFYACSIALFRKNQPVLGVIKDLPNQTIYSGIVNEGAWCNGKPMQVSTTAQRDQALVTTGYPVAMNLDRDSLKTYQNSLIRFKKIRMLGSAAMMIVMVASGQADVYMENNTRLWDVAAGLAIVEAAGGKVTWEQTTNETTLNVRAWNGRFSLDG